MVSAATISRRARLVLALLGTAKSEAGPRRVRALDDQLEAMPVQADLHLGAMAAAHITQERTAAWLARLGQARQAQIGCWLGCKGGTLLLLGTGFPRNDSPTAY